MHKELFTSNMKKGDIVSKRYFSGPGTIGIVISVFEDRMFESWASVTMVNVVTINGYKTWFRSELEIINES